MRDPRVRLALQVIGLALGVALLLTSTLPPWARVLAVVVALVLLGLAVREYLRVRSAPPPRPPSP